MITQSMYLNMWSVRAIMCNYENTGIQWAIVAYMALKQCMQITILFSDVVTILAEEGHT